MATTTTDYPLQSDADTDNDSMTAVQKLREQADAVVQRIQPQIAAVSTYARNEPTKALLISAATGAALMGLIALMVRGGGRSSASSLASSASSLASSAMAAIRDAALELADSAHGAATDALDASKQRGSSTLETTHKRAASAFEATKERAASALEATQKRAASAADTVSESVADAWKKVRDQAGPMVDKVRPQIEAATTYVKEDPTRAALGLAAAGALVAGLIALTRRSQDDDYPSY